MANKRRQTIPIIKLIKAELWHTTCCLPSKMTVRIISNSSHFIPSDKLRVTTPVQDSGESYHKKKSTLPLTNCTIMYKEVKVDVSQFKSPTLLQKLTDTSLVCPQHNFPIKWQCQRRQPTPRHNQTHYIPKRHHTFDARISFIPDHLLTTRTCYNHNSTHN